MRTAITTKNASSTRGPSPVRRPPPPSPSPSPSPSPFPPFPTARSTARTMTTTTTIVAASDTPLRGSISSSLRRQSHARLLTLSRLGAVSACRHAVLSSLSSSSLQVLVRVDSRVPFAQRRAGAKRLVGMSLTDATTVLMRPSSVAALSNTSPDSSDAFSAAAALSGPRSHLQASKVFVDSSDPQQSNIHGSASHIGGVGLSFPSSLCTLFDVPQVAGLDLTDCELSFGFDSAAGDTIDLSQLVKFGTAVSSKTFLATSDGGDLSLHVVEYHLLGSCFSGFAALGFWGRDYKGTPTFLCTSLPFPLLERLLGVGPPVIRKKKVMHQPQPQQCQPLLYDEDERNRFGTAITSLKGGFLRHDPVQAAPPSLFPPASALHGFSCQITIRSFTSILWDITLRDAFLHPSPSPSTMSFSLLASFAPCVSSRRLAGPQSATSLSGGLSLRSSAGINPTISSLAVVDVSVFDGSKEARAVFATSMIGKRIKNDKRTKGLKTADLGVSSAGADRDGWTIEVGDADVSIRVTVEEGNRLGMMGGEGEDSSLQSSVVVDCTMKVSPRVLHEWAEASFV